MKTIAAIFSTGLLLFFTACGPSAPTAETASPAEVTRIVVTGDEARTVAVMSISGMTCAHGCGGKIQQDLRALEGVLSTDLNYADGRDANVVSVQFDPARMDEQKLIQCVNGIADGQYHVMAVEVQTVKPASASSGGSEMDQPRGMDLDVFFQVFNLLSSFLELVS